MLSENILFSQKQPAYIVQSGTAVLRGLDTVSDEAQQRARPQESGKPPEHVLQKLDPCGGGLGWRQRVRTVGGQQVRRLFSGQPLQSRVVRKSSVLSLAFSTFLYF